MTVYEWQDLVNLNELGYKPKRISKGKTSFWVYLIDGDVVVIRDECAHMGSPLTCIRDGFLCPAHGWMYDKFGNNTVANNPPLRKIKSQIVRGEIVQIYQPALTGEIDRMRVGSELSIRVLSHACLDFKYKSYSIIFDPWLVGNAYYGSWELFPNAKINIQDLNPNAIIISHPHPDHFSLETLKNFNKAIPVYFPEFSSNIIPDGLKELGFENVNHVMWNQEIKLNDSISIIFARPRSMWEDSAVLVKVLDDSTDFVWLNQVDAGAPYDIENLERIDLLSSAFDQGASGYPLTWENISVDRQKKILLQSKENTLNNLPNLCKSYGAKYFLPFAGHWRLSQVRHQEYSERIPHTSFSDIIDSFELINPGCLVVDIYPGESFNFESNHKVIDSGIRDKVTAGYIGGSNIDIPFEKSLFDSSKNKFKNYMNSLSSQAASFSCEHVELTIQVEGSSDDFIFKFAPEDSEPLKVQVKISFYIFLLIAEGKANWDHIAIGYWGYWKRNSESYPANFMRLLQSGPIYKNQNSLNSNVLVIDDISIADLIELDEIKFPALLTRLGLPCLACTKLNSETLGNAIRIHNIDLKAVSWALREVAHLYESRTHDNK